MMKKVTITLFTILTLNYLYASEVFSLSLEEVLTNAVQKNPVIKIESLRTDAAHTIYRENMYRYEPQVQMGVGRSSVMNSSDNQNYNASLQLTETLPTGTNIELRGSVEAPRQTQVLEPQRGYQNRLGFTVTQSLLQGLNPNANLAPLRKARIDISLRKEELAGYAQRLLADTERAYWELLLSKRELTIHEQSLELAKRLLYESEERLRVGRIAALDLATIRAEVSERKRHLIDAQTAYLQRQYRLVHLMNTPELWDTKIVPADTIFEVVKPDSLHYHLKAAKKFRPDLRQANALVDKGELDVIHTRDGLLPKLDFFISMHGTSYSQSFSEAMRSYSDPSGVIEGGLTLSFPVTQGGARERHRRAQLSKEQLCLSIENMVRLIEYEVRSAYAEVNRAYKQIEAASVTESLQKEKLRAEEEKFAAGKSTGFLVLQAQRDLIGAQIEKARARVAFSNSVTDLYLKDGTLLERRGVDSMR
ncbi:TolC family protein [Chitinispirillales bacterium ANBcel5]|uniref:TolC family protein n=1 Tax=Cellulosispirillum alkaliphilum TaxID=3039283 RepID=UPI002A587CE3|nr:TolC family protein [Chitinispirillales bacterium ANBcel5]